MPEKVNKIYWAPARNYCLHFAKSDPEIVGIYQREKRDMQGNVIQPAQPIRFGENVFATDDFDLQKVIENSPAFKGGEIKLCESLEAANQLSAAKQIEKKVSSGLVTMTDDPKSIQSEADAKSEMAKAEIVRS